MAKFEVMLFYVTDIKMAQYANEAVTANRFTHIEVNKDIQLI